MKKKGIIILFMIQSIFLLGQEQVPLDLLETDSTWGKELFKFPIHFAQEINYQGIEEAKFPKGWGDADHPNFWSYVFAWDIDLKEELTEKKLEANLQLYFDGLMSVVNKDKERVLPKTTALFLKKGTSNHISRYVGKVKIFDVFSTQKNLILNVLVEQYYCEQKKKSVVIFKFSPKEFGHATWLKLENVRLHTNICNR
ncbi:hypothetical protein [Aureispira anguillae]|uniref:Uncharacterized protein n=1 Tax=Aureispira anguillae TaxID=2864201 RepID=A0A915YC94_9BACT|nr:hypothetical protein [Aureispira anguillae]BDS10428.1 hypothetical protein AsAng_0011360 [Aureispira anguillae]